MKTPRHHFWIWSALLYAGAVGAQHYPARAIQVVVPMQVGSAGDVAVRIVVRKMAASLGQPLAVENIAGAAGRIGTQRIAHAPADGYTIGGMGDSMLTVLPHLQPGLDFDSFRDFEPISMIATVTSVLITHPALPVASVRDLVALSKTRPTLLDYASAGVGSQQHLAMELFRDATGARLNHIPFRGASQAAMEVVSGRVQVMFGALSIVLPFIKDGRLNVVAVASKKRSALLPATPTMIESGVNGFSFSPWVALFAPNQTPHAVVERLNREVAAALNDSDIRIQLNALGIEPEASSPEELRQKTKDDFARMGKTIKASGIRNE